MTDRWTQRTAGGVPRRRRTRAAATAAAALAAAALGLAGCGPSMRVFLHPQADMTYYTNVGVLPFRSLAADRLAGEKFAVEFTTALLATRRFEVVDRGIFLNDVSRAIGSTASPNGLTRDQIEKIGRETGVQAVFVGTVTQYEMVPTSGGTFPVISVEARMLDTQTGTVVWQATITARGGPKTPIIGFGEVHTLGELSQRLARKLVGRLD